MSAHTVLLVRNASRTGNAEAASYPDANRMRHEAGADATARAATRVKDHTPTAQTEPDSPSPTSAMLSEIRST